MAFFRKKAVKSPFNVSNGQVIRFPMFGAGGDVVGLLELRDDDPNNTLAINELRTAAKAGRFTISEITPEQFTEEKKKRPPLTTSDASLGFVPRPKPPLADLRIVKPLSPFGRAANVAPKDVPFTRPEADKLQSQLDALAAKVEAKVQQPVEVAPAPQAASVPSPEQKTRPRTRKKAAKPDEAKAA